MSEITLLGPPFTAHVQGKNKTGQTFVAVIHQVDTETQMSLRVCQCSVPIAMIEKLGNLSCIHKSTNHKQINPMVHCGEASQSKHPVVLNSSDRSCGFAQESKFLSTHGQTLRTLMFHKERILHVLYGLGQVADGRRRLGGRSPISQTKGHFLSQSKLNTRVPFCNSRLRKSYNMNFEKNPFYTMLMLLKFRCTEKNWQNYGY